VDSTATYRLQPRLRQNGMRSVSIFRLVKKSSPKNMGGGRLKISVRECVAKTNMK
jgi:hypothetical protein